MAFWLVNSRSGLLYHLCWRIHARFHHLWISYLMSLEGYFVEMALVSRSLRSRRNMLNYHCWFSLLWVFFYFILFKHILRMLAQPFQLKDELMLLRFLRRLACFHPSSQVRCLATDLDHSFLFHHLIDRLTEPLRNELRKRCRQLQRD